jgi:preprotein translocase subunit SecD
MASHFRWLIFVVLLTLFATWVALPETNINNIPDSCYNDKSLALGPRPTQGIHVDGNDDCLSDITLNVRQALGLDIIGGLRVLLEAELPPSQFTPEDLRTTANNVAKRVNALGVGEATVQTLGNTRILVELPGVTDPQQAVDTIQKTALLEFVDFAGLGGQAGQLAGQRILTDKQLEIQQQREAVSANQATQEATAEPTPSATQQPAIANPLNGQPFHTVMTGAGLRAAAAQLSPEGRWIIQFELTGDENSQNFGPYTAANIGQPMAIVLDGVVLSAPTIQSELPTGGVITGRFTEQEAKTLALQLRSGALPIPLRVLSSETVGATLGQESINLSIRAGIIGVVIILTFMTANYRIPGLAASLALIVFIVLNLAIFKLLPVTLTLPAIVGFLISIGAAVDGNILIFERIREELRSGKDTDAAVIEGFSRAWSSIRDSNLSTIIISAVLFLFGQTPGASTVSGFAVTLALGLIINLFTAIVVTRTFLHALLLALRRPTRERLWLMGV